MSHWAFSLQDVRRLLRNASERELGAEAILRLKWFLYALEHEGNVSKTCRHFGISRSTFLRWAERFDATDLATLDEQSRRPHTVREPETDPMIVALIRNIRIEHPTIGKERIVTLLRETHGVSASPSTVGRVINRHKLFFADSAAHRAKRSYTSEVEETLTQPVRKELLSEESDEVTSDVPFLPEPGLHS